MDNGYRGLDLFRMAAAFLVIAIHTSPFSAVNGTFDFLITYCACRVAVPFFFLTTGFFVLGPSMARGFWDWKAIKKYYRKNVLLYLAAILLYLPAGFYSGLFPCSLLQGCKMLLFDGTFYHLWYFPAVMIGTALLLLFRRSLKSAVLFSAAAYLAGVFGDSLFGLAKGVPLLNELYERLFSISSYTRNGIFFAPLFLLLGAVSYRLRLSASACRRGLLLSFPLMLLEGGLSYSLNLQRHNSMYLLLPFVSLFLFQLLLTVRGRACRRLRSYASCIYVIHPAVLILLRGLWKIACPGSWPSQNPFLEFLLVSFFSLAGSFVLFFFYRRWNDLVHKKPRLDRTRS